MIGQKYEEKAIEIIKNKGYIILEKNFRNRYGEIDIIAVRNGIIIFFEVKYRKNDLYGMGFESIDRKKIKKIFATSQYYIISNNMVGVNFRIDCISFLGEDFTWIKDIAWGDEIGMDMS